MGRCMCVELRFYLEGSTYPPQFGSMFRVTSLGIFDTELNLKQLKTCHGGFFGFRISILPLGKPDKQKLLTSFVERQNLTMRMQMRRFTRLTNAFSKKFEKLKAFLALHLLNYNFIYVIIIL